MTPLNIQEGETLNEVLGLSDERFTELGTVVASQISAYFVGKQKLSDALQNINAACNTPEEVVAVMYTAGTGHTEIVDYIKTIKQD